MGVLSFFLRGILSVLDFGERRCIELKFGNYGLNFTSGLRKTRKATGVEYTRLFNTSLAVVAIGVYSQTRSGARADAKPHADAKPRAECKPQRASESEPPIAGS